MNSNKTNILVFAREPTTNTNTYLGNYLIAQIAIQF